MTPWRLYRRPRTKVWWARRTVDGVRESKSTGETAKKDAEGVIRRWNSQASNPAYARAEEVTFGNAVNRFLEQSQRKLSQGKLSEATLEIHGYKAANLLRVIGAKTRLSRITAAVVADYCDTRTDAFVCGVHAKAGAKKTDECDGKKPCGDGCKPHSVQKELCVLRGVLALARHRGEFALDPDALMPPDWSADYRPVERHLSPEEWRALSACFTPARRAHLQFILATGARRAEAERARRTDIDLEGMSTLLRGTKTEKSYDRVPIIAWTKPMLEQVLADAPGEDLLFDPWPNLLRDVKNACRRIKIASVSPNDLRRTFASWLVQDGLPNELVAQCLRHASTAMVERVYGKRTDISTRKLIEAHYASSSLPPTAASVPTTH